MTEEVIHSHSVGEMPTNPLIDEKWVRYITNIQQEDAPEGMDDGQTHWSYDIVATIPLAEYVQGIQGEIELAAARAETNAFETTLYLIAASNEEGAV
ncbi:MAG: hypothetical protein E7Z72_00670 [Methanocorpusculum parvum]|nr:hypothetical protein [Methanocorpusculum parvum]